MQGNSIINPIFNQAPIKIKNGIFSPPSAAIPTDAKKENKKAIAPNII